MAAADPTKDLGSFGSLQRKSSSGTNRLSSAVHRDGTNEVKQSDLYLTELLSYSLDRLRKVWHGGTGLWLVHHATSPYAR